MKHIWTVACSRAVIDRYSNNVSIQNVLEQITVPEKPVEGLFLPYPVDVITLWARNDFSKPSSGNARIRLLSPSGKTLGEFVNEVDLTEHERSRSKISFRGLPIPEDGIFTFRLDKKPEGSQRWRKVAEVPIQVSYKPEG